jgi:hypothetical protein
MRAGLRQRLESSSPSPKLKRTDNLSLKGGGFGLHPRYQRIEIQFFGARPKLVNARQKRPKSLRESSANKRTGFSADGAEQISGG